MLQASPPPMALPLPLSPPSNTRARASASASSDLASSDLASSDLASSDVGTPSSTDASDWDDVDGQDQRVVLLRGPYSTSRTYMTVLPETLDQLEAKAATLFRPPVRAIPPGHKPRVRLNLGDDAQAQLCSDALPTLHDRELLIVRFAFVPCSDSSSSSSSPASAGSVSPARRPGRRVRFATPLPPSTCKRSSAMVKKAQAAVALYASSAHALPQRRLPPGKSSFAQAGPHPLFSRAAQSVQPVQPIQHGLPAPALPRLPSPSIMIPRAVPSAKDISPTSPETPTPEHASPSSSSTPPALQFYRQAQQEAAAASNPWSATTSPALVPSSSAPQITESLETRVDETPSPGLPSTSTERVRSPVPPASPTTSSHEVSSKDLPVSQPPVTVAECKTTAQRAPKATSNDQVVPLYGTAQDTQIEEPNEAPSTPPLPAAAVPPGPRMPEDAEPSQTSETIDAPTANTRSPSPLPADEVDIPSSDTVVAEDEHEPVARSAPPTRAAAIQSLRSPAKPVCYFVLSPSLSSPARSDSSSQSTDPLSTSSSSHFASPSTPLLPESPHSYSPSLSTSPIQFDFAAADSALTGSPASPASPPLGSASLAAANQSGSGVTEVPASPPSPTLTRGRRAARASTPEPLLDSDTDEELTPVPEDLPFMASLVRGGASRPARSPSPSRSSNTESRTSRSKKSWKRSRKDPKPFTEEEEEEEEADTTLVPFPRRSTKRKSAPTKCTPTKRARVVPPTYDEQSSEQEVDLSLSSNDLVRWDGGTWDEEGARDREYSPYTHQRLGFTSPARTTGYPHLRARRRQATGTTTKSDSPLLAQRCSSSEHDGAPIRTTCTVRACHEPSSDLEEDSSSLTAESQLSPSVKRGRGRPRKSKGVATRSGTPRQRSSQRPETHSARRLARRSGRTSATRA